MKKDIYSKYCNLRTDLALDAVDTSGDQHLHIDYNIYKRKLDLNGVPIEPPQKEGMQDDKLSHFIKI